MNPNLTSAARAVLEQLNVLENAPSASATNVDTARLWQQAIRETLAFLDDTAHNVVFIGDVGVGKSSLIGVLANLVVGTSPSDRASLKENSVLAIGSGRTTVCEVRIRAAAPTDDGEVGLLVEPFEEGEMTREIEIYAEREVSRRKAGARATGEDDADPTSQEVDRAIRGMTGYADRPRSALEGGVLKPRGGRPLDVAVASFKTAAALAEHLIERANLPARKERAWWWDTSTEESLTALKRLFADVNQGLAPTAMLPKRMTVVVPDPLPDSSVELNLTLIDTRGLDGKVEARRDLQALLRDPRAVTVLCAPFKNAPGDALRALLGSMATDAELRQALPQTLLVLIDQGDADQVNGADGDRDFGQELKVEECSVALQSIGPPRLDTAQLLAFDALNDDRGLLLAAIDDRLVHLRTGREETLRQQIADAQSFFDSSRDTGQGALRDLVDQKIRDTMALHSLEGVPLSDPLAGISDAIRECRYGSVVYATCRRNGTYRRLDLYAAVSAEAALAATAWLSELMRAVEVKLEQLLKDAAFVRVQEHVRLRKRQFEEGQIKVIRGYAKQVEDQVEALLNPDLDINPVWIACRGEWGHGPGYKERVLNHLKTWARQERGLTAHERTDAATLIPFLGEIGRPVQAPRFTLHVCNLRALRETSWTPEPVSLLIGANGAGKTTLLKTLRLLRVAFELGLPTAVNRVLGGSSNLKSWDAPAEAPVEIGLTLGEARWQIELVPRAGSVDFLTSERFSDGAREIFSRDTLGAFIYGAERLEPSPLTGLRVLMDRGAHEPALRRVASFLQTIAVYHEPDLATLREGSRTTEDRYLLPRGTNALTLLRRWFQDRTQRHRYQFVIDGLSTAFPGTFSDLDFVEAGTTLVARIYRPGSEAPGPLESEANGVLQLLVLFCEVAATDDGSVVAIDEPENGLHPYALSIFLEQTSRWANEHNVTVLLATHSTVLLDELKGNAEQVFVMTALPDEKTAPTRLDVLRNPDWLSRFKLGDLYEQGEIGSNQDEA